MRRGPGWGPSDLGLQAHGQVPRSTSGPAAGAWRPGMVQGAVGAGGRVDRALGMVMRLQVTSSSSRGPAL